MPEFVKVFEASVSLSGEFGRGCLGWFVDPCRVGDGQDLRVLGGVESFGVSCPGCGQGCGQGGGPFGGLGGCDAVVDVGGSVQAEWRWKWL